MKNEVGEWGINNVSAYQEWALHIPCNSQLIVDIKDGDTILSIVCNKCRKFLPKTVLAYFIMSYPTRFWRDIDISRYGEKNEKINTTT